jgi:hypothetical protein
MKRIATLSHAGPGNLPTAARTARPGDPKVIVRAAANRSKDHALTAHQRIK